MCLLYSLAQNFISAKMPLIVQGFCWKLSRESELGATVSGLSFCLLGRHLDPRPGDYFLIMCFVTSSSVVISNLLNILCLSPQ